LPEGQFIPGASFVASSLGSPRITATGAAQYNVEDSAAGRWLPLRFKPPNGSRPLAPAVGAFQLTTPQSSARWQRSKLAALAVWTLAERPYSVALAICSAYSSDSAG